MRKLLLAFAASLAFAVAACGPGGDRTTGPTVDPGATTPVMTDPLGTPGVSPTDGMTAEPTDGATTSP